MLPASRFVRRFQLAARSNRGAIAATLGNPLEHQGKFANAEPIANADGGTIKGLTVQRGAVAAQ